MKKQHLELLVPIIFTALALALTVSAGAQAPPAPTAPSATKSPQAAPMPGHDKHTAAAAGNEAEMKTECEAMMAKKKKMHDTHEANGAALDKLVAEMNAAKSSKEKDAMEKPMAAVLTELVAQSKASHSMMEMQPEMMAHMMRHMEMHATKGAMECPMMKMGMDHDTVPGATKPGGQP